MRFKAQAVRRLYVELSVLGVVWFPTGLTKGGVENGLNMHRPSLSLVFASLALFGSVFRHHTQPKHEYMSTRGGVGMSTEPA